LDKEKLVKLKDVINEKMILLDPPVKDKDGVIHMLVDLMSENGKLFSSEQFLTSVYDREQLLSTYCGFYVAIPHGISETVKEPGVCFARIPEISWGPEQEKVRYVFLLAVPKIDDNRQSPHLKLLSAIAVSSLEEDIREIWANASSEVEILESLKPALNGPEND
jgi:PTS system fructose-specific IIA component